MNKEFFQVQVDMWYARDEHAKTKDLLAAAKRERDEDEVSQGEVMKLREKVRDLVRERDVARMEGVGMKEELSEVKGELERVRMELGFVKAEKERLGNEVEKMVREREMREFEEMVEKQLKIKKEKEEKERLQMVPGAFPAPEIEVFTSAV
jgi:glucan-binding YG repeat protein